MFMLLSLDNLKLKAFQEIACCTGTTVYNYSDFIKWQRYKTETEWPARLLNHTDNKNVLVGQESTSFSQLFLEKGIISIISKFKTTQCIAHLYLWGNWSAGTITVIVESPYISQFYYYPILHHQLTLTIKATLKRTWKYLDQPMCFFGMQKLQKDTKSTNMKCNECDAPPGRKFPAALLCLLYACFHEGLFNSTLSAALHLTQ